MNNKKNEEIVTNSENSNELFLLEDEQKKLESILLEEKLKEKKEIDTILYRTKKHINNSIFYSLESFIKELLPILDNLEKAEELIKTLDNEMTSFINELKLILKNFIQLFKNFHVSTINKLNVPFDPKVHQAISVRHLKNIQSNYVVEILQKGYLLHQRLLRPAMVIVSQ